MTISGPRDPRVVAREIRRKHMETLAQIRAALGTRATTAAADLLDGLTSLLGADGHLNDAAGSLLESNVTAARARRQQAEAAAATTKGAKRAPIGGAQ